jgi:hypothetical protein
MRIGHVRDEADPGGEEMIAAFLRAWDVPCEFGREMAADGRDVDSDLLEDLAGHLAAHASAAGRTREVGPFPRDIAEGGFRARLALDLLERGAYAVAQRFEPGAGGLLLFVELEHRSSHCVG